MLFKTTRLSLWALTVLQLSNCLAPLAVAGLYDPPPLVLQSYASLQYPPQLTRAEVQWMIQTATDALDQKSFVDLGDLSDFMHMHVLMRPRDLQAMPAKFVLDMSWQPPWENTEMIAALIHTQEYKLARALRPYLDRKGFVVGPEGRNQILWLQDSEFGRRGVVVSARPFAKSEEIREGYTISSPQLNSSITGPHIYDWEFPLYFFRVHCPDVDALVAAGEKLSESNVVEVMVGGQRACLSLMHFHCRNYPDDKKYCAAEPKLRPYYDHQGPISY